MSANKPWNEKFEIPRADALTQNPELLYFAMQALFSTYIVNDEAAKARGEAIQAVDRLHVLLTGDRLIPQFEPGA